MKESTARTIWNQGVKGTQAHILSTAYLLDNGEVPHLDSLSTQAKLNAKHVAAWLHSWADAIEGQMKEGPSQ